MKKFFNLKNDSNKNKCGKVIKILACKNSQRASEKSVNGQLKGETISLHEKRKTKLNALTPNSMVKPMTPDKRAVKTLS